jgi:hypothetical protein
MELESKHTDIHLNAFGAVLMCKHCGTAEVVMVDSIPLYVLTEDAFLGWLMSRVSDFEREHQQLLPFLTPAERRERPNDVS